MVDAGQWLNNAEKPPEVHTPEVTSAASTTLIPSIHRQEKGRPDLSRR